MDKTESEPSNDKDKAPNSPEGANGILNFLNRFRKKSKASPDPQAPFYDRLGAASGPLAEQISEISNLIETKEAGGNAPQAAENETKAAEQSEQDATEAGDAAKTTESDKPDTQREPRKRSMGFHNPVFSAKPPDPPKDPDFSASTQPPSLKIHDAPDGVMENSGAPEKRLTPPKKKRAEPFDPQAFAEQVRSHMPKPEPETQTAEDQVEEKPTTKEEADAAFKENFYARMSKASKASVFEGFAGEKPKILHMPVSITNLEARNVTASTALQSWRKFQSADDRNEDGEEAERQDKPVRPVETEAPQTAAEPPTTEEPDGNGELQPAPDMSAAAPDSGEAEHPEPEEQTADTKIDAGQDAPSQQVQEDDPAPPPAEAEASEADDPHPETLPDTNPAAGTTDDPELQDEVPPEDTLQIAPDNLFDALNISEEELLTNVYDAIQEELRAAWGENITLNIRRIVREEVRAAVEKARSGT